MEAVEKHVVAAMTRRLVIGRAGDLPWHLPRELALFRELTWGHAVVMGRRTLEAIGHPLAGRRNVVLSRTMAPRPDLIVCRDFASAVAAAEAGSGRVFFIGGQEVFRRALPVAQWLHISWVRREVAGDAFFPPFDGRAWRVVEAVDYGEFRHVRYRRRAPG